jgi:hypothetical protein
VQGFWLVDLVLAGHGGGVDLLLDDWARSTGDATRAMMMMTSEALALEIAAIGLVYSPLD